MNVYMITSMIRTVILYFFITLAIRLMGKRQIGDLQPNELVVTLLISEIAAIPLQDPSRPLSEGIVAIFILVVLEIIMSILPMKSMRIRKWISGSSVVIIKNGEIDQKAMKKVRMTVLDLIEMLRMQNIFDLSTVAYAVLEVNGNLSVLLKDCEMPVTKKDMNLKREESDLPLPVISDGKTVSESLSALQIQPKEFESILAGKKESEIFLMMLDKNKNALTVFEEEPD